MFSGSVSLNAEPRSQICATGNKHATSKTLRTTRAHITTWAHLDVIERVVRKNVVWLDVGVHDAQSAQTVQSDQQLLRVHPDSRDADSNTFAEFIQHLLQVHAEQLKHQAQVSAVFEMPQQLHDMSTTVRVRLANGLSTHGTRTSPATVKLEIKSGLAVVALLPRAAPTPSRPPCALFRWS